MIEVDVFCQWVDECERLEAAKRQKEQGTGLGLLNQETMTAPGAHKRKEKSRRRDDGSDEEDESEDKESDNPEEKDEVSEESEEEEEIARPVKKGPAFGAAAKKTSQPKHKYLEPTGRITEAQVEKERTNLLGKKRLHRYVEEDDEDDIVIRPSKL